MWRVGTVVKARLWDRNKNSIIVIGTVTSRIPARGLLNIMDDRGHMWRVAEGDGLDVDEEEYARSI